MELKVMHRLLIGYGILRQEKHLKTSEVVGTRKTLVALKKKIGT